MGFIKVGGGLPGFDETFWDGYGGSFSDGRFVVLDEALVHEGSLHGWGLVFGEEVTLIIEELFSPLGVFFEQIVEFLN